MIPSNKKISFYTILKAVNSTSGFIHVSRIPARIGGTCKCACTQNFLPIITEKIQIKLSYNFSA